MLHEISSNRSMKPRTLRRKEIFTDEVIVAFILKARKLVNAARFDEVYKMAKEHLKRHPDSLLFAYNEAAFAAEQVVGFNPAQLKVRHAGTARKLKLLLRCLHRVHPHLRSSVRNEYYWFSKQPYKQYLLGKEIAAKGRQGSYYSQGIRASQVAKSHALKGNKRLMGVINLWETFGGNFCA